MKPPFGGPQQVLAYLAAYTHRIAIANRRILAFDGERVSFSWRDYADGNAQKIMTLDAVEFLRRFLMHVIPPRFVRIRCYGFLTNCSRAANIAKARELIGSTRALPVRPDGEQMRLCPQCHQGTMITAAIVERAASRTWFDTS